MTPHLIKETSVKILRQLALVLFLLFFGELIKLTLHLPIPGSVLGMLLLLGGLISGIIPLTAVEEISDFFLDHLAFFFLPAGVGLLAYTDLIQTSGIQLFTICLVSTVLVMGFTGFMVQLTNHFVGLKKKEDPHA